MQVRMNLGGVTLLFLLERNMEIDKELIPFVISETVKEELTVRVSWNWENVCLPKVKPLGEDLICRYYEDGKNRWCVTRGGPKGCIACTMYTADFSDILCTINEKPFLLPLKKLGTVLRMLPMREIFLHFGTLFLHAAQIVCRGRGILFTAPSGTGKTTQARLWQRHRGAEVVCNDRTLTRKVDGVWRTYGYPVDGSEPVRSSAVNTLGAVVLLEQGPVNGVSRLRPAKALPRLMRQMVLDCWSGEARTAAMELLLNLMEDIPVYLLTCTPDEWAVDTLEAKLTEDEVISPG